MPSGGGALTRLWQALRPRLWPVLAAAAGVALILALVRPFAVAPPPEAEDVALAWNESIARLGLLPVFPPEEDLHVGDLWAVIAEDGEQTPLLGKAVRLAHIDLRDEFRASRGGQPVFPDTTPREAGAEFRRQPGAETGRAAPDDPITLTLTAFPGISIRHARRAGGSLVGGGLGAFGAGQEAVETEEIRIPVAETYGVPAARAIGRLDAWCGAPETEMYCTDAFARRVLAFAVSDRVLAVRDGRYLARLQLQLVTRVFLAREIEHRRARDASGGAAARAPGGEGGAPPAAVARTDPSQGPEAQARAALDAREALVRAAMAGDAPLAAGQLFRTDGSEIALRQVFQRPVVFGYRAVTAALPPATPPAEESPP